MKKEKRTYFIAIVGMTPAVLTETVWSLVFQENIIPDSIIVFTTNNCVQKLKEFKKKHWNNMVEAIRKKVGAKFGPYSLSFQESGIKILTTEDRFDLDDVRTKAENMSIANAFYKEIADLLYDDKNDVRLIASIAGGRKSMGAMLHSVMSVLGRKDDKIYHILTSGVDVPPASFAYPGCVMTDKKERMAAQKIKLDLAEVPFVPIASIIKESKKKQYKNYKDLLYAINNIIEDSPTRIKLIRDKRTLEILYSTHRENIKLELSHVECLITATYFRRTKEGKFASNFRNDLREEYLKLPKDIRSKFDIAFSKRESKMFAKNISSVEQADITECIVKEKTNYLRSKKLSKKNIADSLINKLFPCQKRCTDLDPDILEII